MDLQLRDEVAHDGQVEGLPAPRRGQFGFGAVVPEFQLEGFFLEDGVFDPIPVQVRNTATGETFDLTIIGILTDIVPEHMIGITVSQSFASDAFGGLAQPNLHLFQLREGVDPEATADELEAAFLENGMEATALSEELDDLVGVNRTFNYIVQGFLGLGLVVGVEAPWHSCHTNEIGFPVS